MPLSDEDKQSVFQGFESAFPTSFNLREELQKQGISIHVSDAPIPEAYNYVIENLDEEDLLVRFLTSAGDRFGNNAKLARAKEIASCDQWGTNLDRKHRDGLIKLINQSFVSAPALQEACNQIEFVFTHPPDNQTAKISADIVKRAWRERWTRLLAFCCLYSVQIKKRKTRSPEFLSPLEQAGLQLLELLENELDDETVISCVVQARTVLDVSANDLPLNRRQQTSIKRTRMSAIHELLIAQPCGSSSTDKVSRGPIYNFVSGIQNRLQQKPVGQQIERWWLQTTDNCFLEPYRPKIRENDRRSLVLTLNEGVSGTEWIAKAWMYFHETANFTPIDRIQEIIPNTPQAISQFLTLLRQRVAIQFPSVSLATLQIQFFLPRPALVQPVDQWLVNIDDFDDVELGFEHPVIVRENRSRPERFNQIRQRWKQSVKDTKICAWKRALKGDDARTLYKEFQAIPELVGLIVESPVGANDPPNTVPILQAALAAGIPIVAWVRCEAAKPAFIGKLTEWKECASQQAPGLLHEFRRSKTKMQSDDAAKNFTLLYEDDDCWPMDILLGSEAR